MEKKYKDFLGCIKLHENLYCVREFLSSSLRRESYVVTPNKERASTKEFLGENKQQDATRVRFSWNPSWYVYRAAKGIEL